jgi:hypothetical protein
MGQMAGFGGEGKAGDDYRPEVKAGSGFRAGVFAKGIWHVEAYAPVELIDPPEVQELADRMGISLRVIKNAIPYSQVQEMQRLADLEARRKLEKLLGPVVLLWSDDFVNLVVNTGLDDYLDKYWKGSTYTAAHYIGLTDGTPTVAAGDTMGSHAGWVEVTAYTEATRPAFTPGTVSGQSVDNSASKAAYTINADGTTIGGAFATTDNTKGGSTGTLVAAGAFSGGDVTLSNNSTLNVTATFTQADDGV